MNRFKATWAALGGAVVLGIGLSYGVAQGQAPGGGGGRGNFQFVNGTVAQVDPQNNAIAVQDAQNNQVRWVQLAPGATMTKFSPVKVEDLKEKDLIVIQGTPTSVTADTLDVRTPEEAKAAIDAAANPNAAAAGGGPGGRGGFFGTPQIGAFMRITGTVLSLPDANANPPKPLVLALTGDAKVEIKLTDKTKVLRRSIATVKDVVKGDQFMGGGTPDQNNVIQARFANTGDLSVLQQGFGGRGGFGGGPGGGPGGRGRGGRGGRGGNNGGN